MADVVTYDKYYTIRFPSERRTIEQIRETLRGDGPEGAMDDKVVSAEARMRSLEEALAEKVFAEGRRLPDLHALRTREELMAELNQLYVRFGVSGGEQETKALVRAFESRVSEQAKHVEF